MAAHKQLLLSWILRTNSLIMDKLGLLPKTYNFRKSQKRKVIKSRS